MPQVGCPALGNFQPAVRQSAGVWRFLAFRSEVKQTIHRGIRRMAGCKAPHLGPLQMRTGNCHAQAFPPDKSRNLNPGVLLPMGSGETAQGWSQYTRMLVR